MRDIKVVWSKKIQLTSHWEEGSILWDPRCAKDGMERFASDREIRCAAVSQHAVNRLTSCSVNDMVTGSIGWEDDPPDQ